LCQSLAPLFRGLDRGSINYMKTIAYRVFICLFLYLGSLTDSFAQLCTVYLKLANPDSLHLDTIRIAIFQNNSKRQKEFSLIKSPKDSILCTCGDSIRIQINDTNFIPLDTVVLGSNNELTLTIVRSNILIPVEVFANPRLIKVQSGEWFVNLNNRAFMDATDLFEVLKNIPMLRMDNNGSIVIANKSTAVILNGKNISLGGSTMESVIKSIPKSIIESITISPTSDASLGSNVAAVIKIETLQFNLNLGNFQLVAGTRARPLVITNASYKYGRNNFYLGFSVNTSNSNPINDLYINSFNDSLSLRDESKRISFSVNSELTYRFNSKHTLDVTAQFGNKRSRGSIDDIDYLKNDSLKRSFVFLQSLYQYKLNSNNKLKFQTDIYNQFSATNSYVVTKLPIGRFNQLIEDSIPMYRLYLLWEKQRRNYKMKLGGSLSINLVNGSSLREFFSSNGQSNSSELYFFYFNEHIYSCFLQNTFTLSENLIFNVGGRLEWTKVRYQEQLESVASSNTNVAFLNFMPNLGFSFSSGPFHHQINLISTTTRPGYQRFLRARTFDYGLLFIEGDGIPKPQQVNAFDWSVIFKGFNFNIQYGGVRNFFATYTDSADGISINKFLNLNRVRTLLLDATYQLNWTNSFITTASINTVFLKYPQKPFELGKVSPQTIISLNNQLRLGESGFRFRLRLDAETNFSDGFYENKYRWWISGAFSFQFKKPNIFVSLFFEDPLKTAANYQRVILPGVLYSERSYSDVRRLGINFIWYFGNAGQNNSSRPLKENLNDIDRIKKT